VQCGAGAGDAAKARTDLDRVERREHSGAEYRHGQEPEEFAKADHALYEDKESWKSPLPAVVTA